MSQAINRLTDVQMDRQTDAWTDGWTDYNIPDLKKTTQKCGHNLPKVHQMTHIKSEFKKKALFVLFSILQPPASICKL